VTGTLINIITVIIGSLFGMTFGARLPERLRQTVISGLGLFTGVTGLQMFLKTENPLVVLGSLLVGGLLGEWWRIEDGLRRLGDILEKRFTRPNPKKNRVAQSSPVDTSVDGSGQEPVTSLFVKGFFTASLVFCVGPMAILGSIQDGLTGDYHLLAIKAVLDGFASLAFASTLGIGVIFSSLVILVYQGGISLMATQAQALISTAMRDEMTAVGGVMLVGIAISSLLEIKHIRVGNFLPALLIAPAVVAILQALKLM
jgi:uncharacterized membrane protein YqgA involved in biofilm formation